MEVVNSFTLRSLVLHENNVKGWRDLVDKELEIIQLIDSDRNRLTNLRRLVSCYFVHMGKKKGSPLH